MIAIFKFFNKDLRFITLSLVVVCFTSTHVFAQSDSSKDQNYIKKIQPTTNSLIRFNKEVSQEVDKAAEIIDKNISPSTPETGKMEPNKTKLYFEVGGDFDDHGKTKGNFRYGAQLHLPRFERYWKVKFANQDEKRDRGQSSMTRQQRTRNAKDDFFLGVAFAKHWDTIDVEYKPQVNLSKGIGLDHSIEAETKYTFGKFEFEPTLEFFANHDDGPGSSSNVKFTFWLLRKLSFDQSNDARFVFLKSTLAENHNVGFTIYPSDRWTLGPYYFRSFTNNQVEPYELSAYGYYLAINYVIYPQILAVEFRPYIVFERGEDFKQANGAVLNFRITF